jgi:hypothetical protein
MGYMENANTPVTSIILYAVIFVAVSVVLIKLNLTTGYPLLDVGLDYGLSFWKETKVTCVLFSSLLNCVVFKLLLS